MKDISDELFEKIKMFERLKFKNRRIKINCVFCTDDCKSLRIDGERYNCIKCIKTGTTSRFIALVNRAREQRKGGEE